MTDTPHNKGNILQEEMTYQPSEGWRYWHDRNCKWTIMEPLRSISIHIDVKGVYSTPIRTKDETDPPRSGMGSILQLRIWPIYRIDDRQVRSDSSWKAQEGASTFGSHPTDTWMVSKVHQSSLLDEKTTLCIKLRIPGTTKFSAHKHLTSQRSAWKPSSTKSPKWLGWRQHSQQRVIPWKAS